jgi:hypothetical protein
MKFKKNKKGSHVGLVLSFVLFIAFVVFVYQILTPFVKGFDEDISSIDSIKKNIVEEVSEEVYSVRIYDDSNPCVRFSTPDSLSGQIVSVDSNGVEIESNITGGQTFVEGSQGLVYLHYGNNFTKSETLTTGSCVLVTPSSVTVEERILEKKIIDLINKTENNYTLAKEELNVLYDQEFEFLFDYMNGTVLGSVSTANLKTNIYSREFIVGYLTIKGEEKTGKLIIKTW